MWTAVIALDFYLMSNPLVFIPVFDVSLQRAVLLTASAVVVNAAWTRVPRVSWPVAAFLVFTLLSAAWSQNAAATLSAWPIYACAAFLAVVTYSQVTPRVLVQGLVWGGVLVSLVSIYAMYRRMGLSYYWGPDGLLIIGVGTNQNILAYTLTLSLCAVCAAVPAGAWSRLLWLACGGIIVYTLVITESSTGDLTAIAVVGAAICLALLNWLATAGRWLHLRRGWVWGSAAACGLVPAIIFGRDLGGHLGTISGRAPFWHATWEASQNHLLLGAGWGAAWAHPWRPAPHNALVQEIYTASGVTLTHGHNSLVDLLPEVGLVGVALGLAILVQVVVTAARLWRRSPAPTSPDRVMSRLALLCVVDLVVFGISEPMSTIPLGWWALVLVSEPIRRRTRTSHYDQTEPTNRVLEKL